MTIMTEPIGDYVPPVWHDGDAPVPGTPEYLPPFTGDPDPKTTNEPEPVKEPEPAPAPEPEPARKK